MHSLFRAFRARRVRLLVIGGQAAILYGAAHFTQDLDVWIDPADANVRRFLIALADRKSRVHKLTPPVRAPFVRRGHGFHFVVRDLLRRPARIESAARHIAAAAHRLQAAGRRYWLPRIAELRELRASGGLQAQGVAVSSLL